MVDLTNCDTEPIHIPGSIQPHGVLLGVDETDWRVAVVSRNAEELLGRPVAAMLGAPLAAVLGEGPADAVQRHVAVTELHVEGASVPLRLARGVGRAGWVGQPVEAVMHRSGGLLVVEIEPDPRDPSSTPLSHRATQAAVTHLAATTTVRDLAQALAAQIRILTGHDRVMVYRFDPDWNGEVIAEDRRDDLEPFLGLHYPASDIPVQARRLYETSWTRVIADVVLPAQPPGVRGSARHARAARPLPGGAAERLPDAHGVPHQHGRQGLDVGVPDPGRPPVGDGRLPPLQRPALPLPRRPLGRRVHRPGRLAPAAGPAGSPTTWPQSSSSAHDLTRLTEHLARDPRPPLEALADHPELLLRLTDATGAVLSTGDRLRAPRPDPG